MAFCARYVIAQTRSRPYKKNDACSTEQKNNAVVRRNVGLLRYESHEHLQLLRELYEYLRLYANFFQPVMMLVSKKRAGAKVYRRYDKPRTPYQRLIARPEISAETKRKLKAIFDELNPAELKRRIDKIQGLLIGTAVPKKRKRLSKPRERRPKRVSHTTPGWRRDDSAAQPNPFLEKVRFEKMRWDMQRVWDARD